MRFAYIMLLLSCVALAQKVEVVGTVISEDFKGPGHVKRIQSFSLHGGHRKPPPPPPIVPLPNTFGGQNTLIMLVNFQDAVRQPYTLAAAQAMYFGTLSSFMLENSYGQTSIVGTVVGWYTIPESVNTCNLTQIASDAQAAALANGTNPSNYARLVYAFPYNAVCGFGGSSTIGGNPSQTWIDGDTQDIHIIAHEFGHALGLEHAHFLNCSAAIIGTNCQVVEYGDTMDVMGQVQTAAPHYNAFAKDRLGWIGYNISPPILTVTASGTYTIGAYETTDTVAKAIKVLKSTDTTTGAKTYYYVEARKALGFDAFLSQSTYSSQNLTIGGLFHTGSDSDMNTSDLLDMTPSTPTGSGWFDMALVTAKVFKDTTAGLTFTTQSVSPSGAVVSVQFSGHP